MADLRMLDTQCVIRNMDANRWLIDGNDCAGDDKCCFLYGNQSWGNKNIPFDKLNGIDAYYFSGQIWMELTTPVNYIGSIPQDPFFRNAFFWI